MKEQQQMNVYARFIADEPRTETPREEATKPRRAAVRTAGGGVRSPKPGVKKRASVPK